MSTEKAALKKTGKEGLYTLRMRMADRLRAYRRDPLSMIIFLLVCLAILATMFVMVYIIVHILVKGIPYLTPSLFAYTYTTENVSVFPAIITTLYMVGLSLLISAPLGIGCAIYMVEYAGRGNRFVKYVRLTTETLAGIPSIIYGLFGTLFFVTQLDWGYSLLAGTLTISIMILPLIIRTTEEAPQIRARSLPGGQLRPGRGQAAHGVPDRPAFGHPRHLFGRDSGNRQDCGRVRRPAVYLGQRSQDSGKPDGVGPDPGYPYVRPLQGGTVYQPGLCHRRGAGGGGHAHQRRGQSYRQTTGEEP